MASLFKRNNGIWTIVYWDGSKRKWLSTGLRDEAEARRYFDAVRGSLEKRRPTTLSELRGEVLAYAKTNLSPGTVALYRLAFDRLIECVGDKQVAHLTPMDAERFKEYLLKQ